MRTTRPLEVSSPALCSGYDVWTQIALLLEREHAHMQSAVRSAPAVLGYGSALAAVLGAFTYTGGKLTGYQRDPTVDEVSRKEYMRKNRRRPVEGTVQELGEGRGEWGLRRDILLLHRVDTDRTLGVYAPGYAERRAERIRENYGIDVTNPQPAVGSPNPQ